MWDGIYTGLEVIRKGTASAKANAQFKPNPNAAVFVLTDGQPNVEPPRGHLPSLNKYRTDCGGVLPAVVHTFGFGYSLDSQLLYDFAIASNGMCVVCCKRKHNQREERRERRCGDWVDGDWQVVTASFPTAVSLERCKFLPSFFLPLPHTLHSALLH